MKIRNGFVSNSSSSSFVVCFSKKPYSEQELKEMLFGDKKVYGNPYPSRHEEGGWPTEEIAGLVWRELVEQKPMTDSDISGEMGDHMDGDFATEYVQKRPPPESPDWPDGLFDDKVPKKKRDTLRAAYDKAYAAYSKKRDAWGEGLAAAFRKKHPGVYFKFTYSDNDGTQQSAMEHGYLFDALPHIRISHH